MDAGTPDIAVGQPVAVIVEDSDAIEAFHDFKPPRASGPKAPSTQARKEAPNPSASATKETTRPSGPSKASQTPRASAKQRSDGGRVFASPYARKIAAEFNIDISQVPGSGPENRIVAADVQKYAEERGAGTGAPSAGIAVGNVDAERVALSKKSIPHYYLTSAVNADAIIKTIASIKDDCDAAAVPVDVRSFVVKAAAAAMKDVPVVNSRWNDDSIRQFDYVDVGVTIVGAQGQVVKPVVTDADLKGLREIARDLAGESASADSTFTISHLDIPAMAQASGIVDPDQAAILTIGAVYDVVLERQPGQFARSQVFNATLSCDHRIIDGAVGAQWLQAFKRYCEDPLSLLL